MRLQNARWTRTSSERGQMLVMTAMGLLMLLGVSALAIDASFLYDKRNELFAAADGAAKSAAAEVDRDSTISLASLERFAKQQVAAHGFTPVSCGASGGTSTCVYHPPVSGSFAGNGAYVEVVLSEPTGLFFAKALGRVALTPGARAVAGITNPSNCLVVMDDMSIGNTTITLSGCGAAVGDTLTGTNPNAAVTGTPTPTVSVTTSCSGTCGAMGDLVTPAPYPQDPLKDLPAFTNPYGSCSAGTAATLSQGCYTSIAETVTKLNAGQYFVTGDLNVGNLDARDGVFIYLSGAGTLKAGNTGNNKALHIKAQTSGTYAGIAIFQDRTDANNIEINNSFTLDVTGAIYMPAVDVDFKNALSITATNCTLFLAKSLTIKNGNSNVTFNNQGCAGTFSGAMFLSFGLAE